MSNPNPHTITPEQRGHRAPLSDEGPSVNFVLRVPPSWRECLKKIGAEQVREWLQKLINSKN